MLSLAYMNCNIENEGTALKLMDNSFMGLLVLFTNNKLEYEKIPDTEIGIKTFSL